MWVKRHPVKSPVMVLGVSGLVHDDMWLAGAARNSVTGAAEPRVTIPLGETAPAFLLFSPPLGNDCEYQRSSFRLTCYLKVTPPVHLAGMHVFVQLAVSAAIFYVSRFGGKLFDHTCTCSSSVFFHFHFWTSSPLGNSWWIISVALPRH